MAQDAQAHMEVVAESVIEVYEHRDQIRGLEMTFEPKFLRFFQARFKPLARTPVAHNTSPDALGATAPFGARRLA